MVNQYGFDFLQANHTMSGGGGNTVPSNSSIHQDDNNYNTHSFTVVSAESVAHKPDLEKQADILRFLKQHRSSGHLPPAIIYRGTGIDLDETDESVARLLEKNVKISTEEVPDPENPQITICTYAYQSKFNLVRNSTTLLAQINRSKNGVDQKDLEDCYDGVEEDIRDLITAGGIIAVYNSEDKKNILFPRGETFLVELDGIVTINPDTCNPNGEVPLYLPPQTANSNSTNTNATPENETSSTAKQLDTVTSSSSVNAMKDYNVCCTDVDVDPLKQIRRGEAISVGGQWFRVSSSVRANVALEDQPARAQAPLTVTSRDGLSKRNVHDGYVRPFNERMLPVDRFLSEEAKENLEKAKVARKLLHKLVSGRSANAASQLLSNNAHAVNPKELAKSLASGAGNRGMHFRSRASHFHTSSHNNNRLSSSNIPSGITSRNTNRDNNINDAKLLQQAASDVNLSLYTHPRRHGCTKDVREMFLETRSRVPTDEQDLQAMLIQHKLLEQGETWRRKTTIKKADVDNDGKKKKRRYYERKNQRMTNTHLKGTIIGALLADAAEKQKQGKSVGDGGM